MKRFLFIIFIVFFVASNAIAAGSVTQGDVVRIADGTHTITFTCTGDASDGSMPDTVITAENLKKIVGWYLVEVHAFPTSGGTAPDAADVLIKDANSVDFLGSSDGSTAYAGKNLIHATLPRAVLPYYYLPQTGGYIPYYPIIVGSFTLSVSNQSTASANWTIVLKFVK